MALGDLIVTSVEHSGSTHEHLGAGLSVLFRLIENQAGDALAMARELMSDVAFVGGLGAVSSPSPASKLDPNNPDHAALIASNREVIAELRALRASSFNEAFGDEVAPDNRREAQL